MKKGFTLIELLLVVLIIGILSAVALPQYSRAVNRARTVECLTTMKAVKDAADLYVIETGNFPTTFDDLSIDLPGTRNKTKNDNDTISISSNYKIAIRSDAKRVQAYPLKLELPGLLYLSKDAKTPQAGTNIYCYATKTDKKRQEVCRAATGAAALASPTASDYLWFPYQ